MTLADEIEHVNAYLQIEQARFQARLQVTLSVPDALAQARLPAFTLQPIVENAIKHGTSQLLGVGEIWLSASRQQDRLVLEIKDNAGLYRRKAARAGWAWARWTSACAPASVTTAASASAASRSGSPA